MSLLFSETRPGPGREEAAGIESQSIGFSAARLPQHLRGTGVPPACPTPRALPGARGPGTVTRSLSQFQGRGLCRGRGIWAPLSVSVWAQPPSRSGQDLGPRAGRPAPVAPQASASRRRGPRGAEDAPAPTGGSGAFLSERGIRPRFLKVRVPRLFCPESHSPRPSE